MSLMENEVRHLDGYTRQAGPGVGVEKQCLTFTLNRSMCRLDFKDRD